MSDETLIFNKICIIVLLQAEILMPSESSQIV